MTAFAQTDTSNSPRWQVIALQVLWLITAGIAAWMLFLAMPDYGTLFDNIFLARDSHLAEFGLPPTIRTDYFPILDTVWLISFIGTAIIIFARKPNEPAAVIISLILMTFPFASLPISEALLINHAEWARLYEVLELVGIILSFSLGYIFPDGRFVPKWTRWVVLALSLWVASWWINPILHPGRFGRIPALAVEVLPFMGAIAAQIYRYRKVSTPTQRQQTKWVILAFGMAVIGYLFFQIPEVFFSVERSTVTEVLVQIVVATFYRGAEMFVPIAIAFAMLRYRLWDVDFIISRSIVYGGLTLLLGALFLGVIFALQPLLLTITGGGQPTLAAVGATLAVAAAFNPVRNGLRRLIDRNLYGIKVDYSKPAARSEEARLASAPTGTTSIGPYSGLHLIGRGGMGEVYQGQHPTNGKPIALKMLPASLAADTDFRIRFEREARTLSALAHPNIVRVYEFGEATGIPYLVMEYIAGHDLSEHLKTTSPLPLEEVSTIISEVAAALDYAHSQGLVHRDIKSSNIMLEDGDSRRAVLMDFGIAKLAQGTALTNTGGVLGTFEYMSPEQIQAASDVDARADVYSLGVVAYEMLTGQLPFTASSPAAVLIAHLQTPPRNPASLRRDLSEDTADALLKALEKDPARRYASAGAFAKALC